MALPFRYRKKATIDFYEAADWYEEQVGKGQEFLDDFIKTLQKIQANPDTYRKVYQDCRRIQFNRFPIMWFMRLVKK